VRIDANFFSHWQLKINRHIGVVLSVLALLPLCKGCTAPTPYKHARLSDRRLVGISIIQRAPTDRAPRLIGGWGGSSQAWWYCFL